jgi:MoaA/NifB/PqqE/SkfB family radical SAM enzyme
MTFTIDIEPTNRCNAKCHFCPRDQTPHQGLMAPEVFEQALRRVVELRDHARDTLGPDEGTIFAVSLCGLGEPLLNRHTPEYVRRVREEGFFCQMSSNGALLDQRRGDALLDAGLQRIYLNVGDRDDDYESVYQLPFEKTLENVVRFSRDAEGRCEVVIVLVDYRNDPVHLEAMRSFWQAQGIHQFQDFAIMNRGGALYVDHMQFEDMPEIHEARRLILQREGQAICGAPLGYMFVGYDGQHYLCCSDWKKEVPLGSVFDASFADVIADKLQYVTSREPICKTCNLDPLNRMTEELRAATPDPEALADRIVADSIFVNRLADALMPEGATPTRRMAIPVRAL